jgi:thiol:disulfide interchange protein DsbD
MEEKVWTKPRVEKMMHNDFILVSLYVDERTKLPAAQQLIYKAKMGNDKSIITMAIDGRLFRLIISMRLHNHNMQ